MKKTKQLLKPRNYLAFSPLMSKCGTHTKSNKVMRQKEKLNFLKELKIKGEIFSPLFFESNIVNI